MNPSASLDGPSFVQALQAIEASDNVKYLTWRTVEKPKQEGETDGVADPNTVGPQQANDKMRQITKTCTMHERKLLCGVVNPTDIHTTFDDIRAPTETIDALKTLTSLALIRPESLSYGVLANDKITGLLLYGPPGTGKTLLAKAVAKESGATVLEVSASELNDMYVGESEKNVKAIFSLARKLSPCVVFLDEADSLLRSRGGGQIRTGHRDLINQFLREWDGLRDMTTLLMVATNRPFDLDEAVLRRLPRKILMDLPVEKDREAILKIHLQDEILDESVSLNDLAKQTPFYSGSDLKNLSIAAALACVRDENLTAAQHVGDTPYVYPEKRTLTKKHFDSALEEISASTSEDMSTLSAIRKFDARYGDRKGRRKRSAGLGFGGASVPEEDSEAGRVRKIEVAT
jgi:SpoVK/Ycf46/Vps4 family AAA+-type ATPase